MFGEQLLKYSQKLCNVPKSLDLSNRMSLGHSLVDKRICTNLGLSNKQTKLLAVLNAPLVNLPTNPLFEISPPIKSSPSCPPNFELYDI